MHGAVRTRRLELTHGAMDLARADTPIPDPSRSMTIPASASNGRRSDALAAAGAPARAQVVVPRHADPHTDGDTIHLRPRFFRPSH